MGAAESRNEVPSNESVSAEHPIDQFVLIMTAPPGVGKEKLMSTFISENVSCMAYVAKVGAVRANQPGLLYFYQSIADAKAEVTHPDTYPTILQATQQALLDGKSAVVDVDVAAVRALRASNVPGCYVFVLPTSMQALRENIEASLQDPESGEIDRAVAASEKEILAVDEQGLYDFSIQNDDMNVVLEEFARLAKTYGQVADDWDGQYLVQVISIPTAPVRSSSASSRAASASATPTGVPNGNGVPLRTYNPSISANSKLSPRTLQARGGDAAALDAHDLVIPPGLQQWRGGIAVVTGAGEGVGAVLSEALTAAGVHVVAAARSKEQLQTLQGRVLASGSGGRLFLPVMCDVTREDEVRTLMSIAVKTFHGKPVSLVINASAVNPADASLVDGACCSWVDMLNHNILAVALCCREACTSMRRADKWGLIINLCPSTAYATKPSSLQGSGLPPYLPHFSLFSSQGLVVGEALIPLQTIALVTDSGSLGNGFLNATASAIRSISQGLKEETAAQKLPLRVSLVTAPAALLSPSPHGNGEEGSSLSGSSLSATDVANCVLHVASQPAHVDVSEVRVCSSGQKKRFELT